MNPPWRWTQFSNYSLEIIPADAILILYQIFPQSFDYHRPSHRPSHRLTLLVFAVNKVLIALNWQEEFVLSTHVVFFDYEKIMKYAILSTISQQADD